jgi:hypothetical protein
VRLGDRQSKTDTGGTGIGAYGLSIVRRRAKAPESTHTARTRIEAAVSFGLRNVASVRSGLAAPRVAEGFGHAI